MMVLRDRGRWLKIDWQNANNATGFYTSGQFFFTGPESRFNASKMPQSSLIPKITAGLDEKIFFQSRAVGRQKQRVLLSVCISTRELKYTSSERIHWLEIIIRK